MITEDQSATIDFLRHQPDGEGGMATPALVQTHISLLVLSGPRVFKLKRAVRLPYLDFSTAEKRLAACQQELRLNRRTAPRLYRAVRRITRAADGRLAFDGPGLLVDAVVEMERFDEDTLLDRMADRHALTAPLLTGLARAIAAFHRNEHPVRDRGSSRARMQAILDTNRQAFDEAGLFEAERLRNLDAGFGAALDRLAPLLETRERAGKIRHCHGDLHLRNICLLEGTPALFDCLEFDADLATIDILYDLAFLLMDLWCRNLHWAANLVLNRYLDELDETDGLPLLPFFMAVRAAIRAHVGAMQAKEETGEARAAILSRAQAYFDLAAILLAQPPARLVAIGGLSGSGKSTVAAAIAGSVGPAPGARILSTDRLRKQLFGVPAETRLPAEAYRPAVSQQVYALQAGRAAAILATGHAVIADAVFDRPDMRAQIARVAAQSGAAFTGIWLQAGAEQILSRVADRRGDPSDATVAVVQAQLARPAGVIDWITVEAGGDARRTAAAVRSLLGL